ncbi:hypothetical protein CJ179_29380 [Rhodococcus sp. ACS1]|nr:PIN domain-containing protein [Rhodococcus sp. ACS1]PBC44885.1 hypothetical protein CJ179_29380 [Rhodococcus sp. ACS1]
MLGAVLDTCVLWPSLQRDFLLSMAVEGLYRPLWSEVILDEFEFHEAAKLERRGHSAAAARAAGARLVGTPHGWMEMDGSCTSRTLTVAEQWVSRSRCALPSNSRAFCSGERRVRYKPLDPPSAGF